MADATRLWTVFALVALVSLAGVMAAVFLAAVTPALLPGWAFGIVVVAAGLLLRRRG